MAPGQIECPWMQSSAISKGICRRVRRGPVSSEWFPERRAGGSRRVCHPQGPRRRRAQDFYRRRIEEQEKYLPDLHDAAAARAVLEEVKEDWPTRPYSASPEDGGLQRLGWDHWCTRNLGADPHRARRRTQRRPRQVRVLVRQAVRRKERCLKVFPRCPLMWCNMPMKSGRRDVLIGADRLRGYAALCSQWDEASRDGPCRLVVVEGPSGAGRTMLLRGLYRHCAMMQQRPRYWPPNLASEELFPDPVVPETGSRMGLLWWALRGRVGGCAAQDAQVQLRLHADRLYTAVRQTDQLTQTRLRAALGLTTLFSSILPVGAEIQSVTNVVAALKDMSDAESTLRGAVETREGLIDRARRANAGRELAVETRATAVQAAQNNGQQLAVVAGIMPVAIVVDDAEFLDAVTIWHAQGDPPPIRNTRNDRAGAEHRLSPCQ